MEPTMSRSSGEGSLYPRHTAICERPTTPKGQPACKCPWQGSLVIGWRDGKPIRKKVSAPTRPGAAAKLRELQEKYKADELPEGKPVTVEQWMTHWLEKIVPRSDPKPGTTKAYNTVVHQYVIPLLGTRRIDRLTPEHIDEAWDQLLDVGNPLKTEPTPIAPNTVHLAHTVLRRALKVAVQRRRLKVNPAGSDSMDAPPRVEKEIEPIPAADVTKILAGADGTPYGARWSVALALGLRPGEALGLRWDDVDLDAGLLHVRQQLQRVKGRGLVATAPKSEAGKRSMFLPPTLLAALKAHRKAQNEARLLAGDHWTDTGLVFTLADGRGIDAVLDRRRWHALLETAGVTPRRLYDARHSAATILLAQGVEMRTAMALLGHSQISVTMRYQHAVDEIKADAATKIEAGVWGSA
jgi:integrase